VESAIDIALWDLKGKAARMAVMELLSVHSTRLRCYATGGYYRKGQTTVDLVREMCGYVEKGFTAIKLKVGKLGGREDAARMKAVREAVGEDVDLLLDANGGWPDAATAISAMRRLEEYRPYWIEEPVRADNVHAMVRIADALDTPVATGELESTRWAFADLIERGAADIVQPDATVVGGVGEWMKVAHMAASFDIPVAPHYNWDIHSQLVAAIPNGIFVEYFMRESGVKMFDDLLEAPLHAEEGYLTPRQEPGFGIRFRPEKVAEFRIA
jgi:D-arabinonate dehydratase